MDDLKNKLSTITIPSNNIRFRRHPIQGYMLIWLDTKIDKSNDDFKDILAQLQNIVNIVNMFTEVDQCINFLNEIKSMKAFLIVNGNINEETVSLIHDHPQLQAIYILCEAISYHEEWTKQLPKIQGLYSEIQSLYETLQLMVKQYNADSIAMSFVSVDEEVSNKSLNQLEPSFMYTQIFKEILLEMKHETHTIDNFALYLRELYKNNMIQLGIIDEFECDYHSEKSIWWYTRTSFIYETLNQALRHLEGDTIINMGFFIHDLHHEIEKLHKEQLKTYHQEPFVLYRGQSLRVFDFKKFQKSQGGLISFNNFLSTSKNRDISLLFAESALNISDTIGVLFQIYIDPSVTSTPYADIRTNSYFETEEEILFSMHSVFRIGEINKLNESNLLYQINLQLTADDDVQLRTLTKRIQKETEHERGLERMGVLLLSIGQFNKAEDFYNILLERTSDQNTKAHYYNQLGYVKDEQGDYKNAIEYYEKAIEIRVKTLPENASLLATSYNNIGVTFRSMEEHAKALLFANKAFEIREELFPPNHHEIAQSYNNIGTIYESKGEYSEALLFYEKALKIREEIFPSNHPEIAASYNNIAGIHELKGQYSNALLYQQKACEIFEKTLPTDHPSCAIFYNNIGELYRKMEDYSKALLYHQKAMTIRKKILSPNHADMAQSYKNIAMVYSELSEFSNSLLYLQQACKIFEENYTNSLQLSVCYNNFGQIYRNMKSYSEALSFSERALTMFNKTNSSNQVIFASIYNNIGLVYYETNEYSKALTYLTPAFDIFQNSLSPTSDRLQCLQKTIEIIKGSI